MQRVAPRHVRGTRETRKAVASGGEQLKQLTKMNFLIDTGADLCVYHRSRFREGRTKTSYALFAANDYTVHTYGYITLRLDFGLRREFSWDL